MDRIESTDKLLVYKSHNLNEMILNTDIQPIEYKLILIGISMINPKPEAEAPKELSVRLPLQTYAKIMGYKYGSEAEKNTVKSNLARDSRNILDISVKKEKKNGGFAEGNIITWFEFNNDRKTDPYIQLWYNEQLREDITNLTGSYVAYRLSNIIHLKKTAHIRLYDLCRQWLVAGRWENVSVEYLREMISRRGGSYKKWYDFKRNVLDPSVEAINKNTDILVSYTTKNLPHEKTVGFVSFVIKPNKSFKSIKALQAEAEALTYNETKSRGEAAKIPESYRNTGLSYSAIRGFLPKEVTDFYALLSMGDESKLETRIKDYIDEKVNLLEKERDKGISIDNTAAWLRKALTEDYVYSEGRRDNEEDKPSGDTVLGQWEI